MLPFGQGWVGISQTDKQILNLQMTQFLGFSIKSDMQNHIIEAYMAALLSLFKRFYWLSALRIKPLDKFQAVINDSLLARYMGLEGNLFNLYFKFFNC